jgi:hypothetical protein
MWYRVALVINVSEERSPSIIRVTRIVCRLLVTANDVPSSPILVTLMREAVRSSETYVLTTDSWRHVPEDCVQLRPREPGVDIYILLWYGSLVIPIATRLAFRHLRLSRLRWRYCNPPAMGLKTNKSNYNFIDFVSMYSLRSRNKGERGEGLIWLSSGAAGWLLWTLQWTFGSEKCWGFLSSCKTGGYSRRAHLCGVSLDKLSVFVNRTE